VEAFKSRPDEEAQAALFIPFLTYTDVGGNLFYAVKFKPGMYSEFSKDFIAEFYRNFPSDQYLPVMAELNQMNGLMSFFSLIKVYMLGIPTAFLLIFAFMGTFGVVWMQSKKRMGELGLRIALGCTPARLMRTIIFENLILTTFAMLPGLIVIAFLWSFAPNGWEWPAAIGAAIVLMWLFSAFSAWYPARQAAKVQPVDALRANQ
jgi:ABC-type antimicrobial peptide transport system permease subunit